MNLEKTNHGIPPLPSTNNLISQRAEAIKRSAVQYNSTMSQNTGESFINIEEVETVVESMNEFIDPLQTNLKFVFHEELNEYYVAVVNPLTNEVVKEIPPKKMLDMYAAMAEFMGILIDEKI